MPPDLLPTAAEVPPVPRKNGGRWKSPETKARSIRALLSADPDRGAKWRGKFRVPPHAHPLVRRFIGILNAEEATISEIGERSGVCRVAISNWQTRGNPLLVNFEAALNALGYKLTITRIPDGR